MVMSAHPPPTPRELKLFEALQRRRVPAVLHHHDGHKTVDIAILPARIYIEIDGAQHFIDPSQIRRDFKRVHFSDGDDFDTFTVTNQMVDEMCDEIANALSEVVQERTRKLD